MSELVVNALTTFEVSADGEQVRIRVLDGAGEAAALMLPQQCVSELMMSLPKMLQLAIERKYRDASLRLVHELGAYTLEQMAGEDKVILTLRTPDGFEVAFSLDKKDIAHIGGAFRGDSPAAALPLLM